MNKNPEKYTKYGKKVEKIKNEKHENFTKIYIEK